MSATRPLKVLLAKAGRDADEHGALVVAMGLREAGLEVACTGIRNTPAEIVAAAIREDVDAIGLPSSGMHMAQFRRVMAMLKQSKVKEVLVLAAGVIPHEDVRKLQKLGIEPVFGPGSSIASILTFLRMRLKQGATARA